MSLANPAVSLVAPSRASEARISGLILALVVVGLYSLCVFSTGVLADGDTWSHIATGDWIMAHHAIPRVDPFSLWTPAPPWTAHEWLSEILLALAYRAGGWSGVVILTGAVAGATALIMGLKVARDLGGAALGVVVMIGVGLWAPNLLARPHVLTLPLTALWVVALLKARDENRAPPLVVAALMIPWSNMHGGFVFGLALIAPFGLEAVIDAAPGERGLAARAWAAFAGAAALAALVNPYGFEALAFPFRLLSLTHLSRISEWKPEDFGRASPFEFGLLALLAFALSRPMAMPRLRMALLVGMVAMALAHARHAQLLGLIAPMLLAPAIARAIDMTRPGDQRLVARMAIVASALLALAMGLVRLATPMHRIDSAVAPISALAAVPADLRQKPVLNDYSFGGYLIWSHIRPFIDGRADMYGDGMLSLYLKLFVRRPQNRRRDAGPRSHCLDYLRAEREDRCDARPRARMAPALR